MKRLLDYILLPAPPTEFEVRYLRRLNRIALGFFAAHVPIFALVAALNGTGLAMSVALTSIVLLGPVIAMRWLENERAVSVVHGVTAMCMGGLLVHFGQGPLQIEMHFYFFVLLALEAVFANPAVVLASAATVAAHHVLLFYLLPTSVFNYQASLWTVLVHALFVVLESIAAIFVARSFFDNVIGLDRIVRARTEALDHGNRQMRLVLDHVREGFVTIDVDGRLASERSRVADRWFGTPTAGMTFFEWLRPVSAAYADACSFAWDEVRAGIMPLELTIQQLPRRFDHRGRSYELDFLPIGDAEPPPHTLVVVRDVTEQRARRRNEGERAETILVFERAGADIEGFRAFSDGASALVAAIEADGVASIVDLQHALHTLKGNAAMYGLASVADICHRLESAIAATNGPPPPALVAELTQRWLSIAVDVDRWIGRRRDVVDVAEADLRAVEAALVEEAPASHVAELVRRIRLQPVRVKFGQFAEQASRIVERLNKRVDVHIDDGGVRLDSQRWAPFWSAFVHGVRNALDHGLETPGERLAQGKRERGVLTLSAREDAGTLTIEIRDDGRGIDWSAIRKKAAEFGLPAETQEELVECLFADGLSTAAQVTDLSGRGAGTGALLAATRALGGVLDVQTTRGAGTTFSMRFDLAQLAIGSERSSHASLRPAA